MARADTTASPATRAWTWAGGLMRDPGRKSRPTILSPGQAADSDHCDRCVPTPAKTAFRRRMAEATATGRAACLAAPRSGAHIRVQVTHTGADHESQIHDPAAGPCRPPGNGAGGQRDRSGPAPAEERHQRLPEGARMEVTITDIQRAGRYEPWRGPDRDHIRILRDPYPPRMQLEFRITGADGQVLAEGQRKLQDLSYL